MRNSMGLMEDYSGWSGISYEAVRSRVLDGRKELAKDYSQHDSEESFYRDSFAYVYDVMSASDTPQDLENKLEKFMPGITNVIKNTYGRLIDFGGGTGLFCEWAVKNTKMHVSYCDLPGHLSSFAEWRFTKHKLSVEMVFAGMTDFTLPRTYDVIFSDAVWEHLDPEMQLRYADKLPTYLNDGGLFVLLIDLAGESIEMPMHYNVDVVKVHDEIEKHLVCVYGRNNFASVWRRV